MAICNCCGNHPSGKPEVTQVEKPSKKELCTGMLVSAMVLIAWLSRFPGVPVLHPNQVIIRAVIYPTLYILWGISLYNRLNHPQVRRYMVTIAALMVFWFAIRIVKFNFTDNLPVLNRYLWYFYYLPMLFIPTLAALVALSIGLPEDVGLPKKTKLLVFSAGLLFLMVITNDLHQMVFTFPNHTPVWTDSDYGYSFGYVLIAVYLLLGAAMILATLYVKCRTPGRRVGVLLPGIPVFVLIVYTGLNFLRVDWLYRFFGDMTAVFCLMYAMTLELCIRCRLIQSNTGYDLLFQCSTLGTQITDEGYHVLLSSANAVPLSAQQMRNSEAEPLLLPEGLRLSNGKISMGHILWTEDMSELLDMLEKLRQVQEELSDERELLAEEYRVKEKKTRMEELDRIYTAMQRETAPQLRTLAELLDGFEASSREEERVALLKKAAVIGAYIKRRNNLLLNAARQPMLPPGEIAFTFRDSMENLELFGVVSSIHTELTDGISGDHLKQIYDLFEQVVELSLDRMSVINGALEEKDGTLRFTVTTDSSADLSGLAGEDLSAERDEDGEWRILLTIPTGGAAL